ncbi:MAG: TrmH family RNA methyltransferase [Bacteroidia bacterium]
MSRRIRSGFISEKRTEKIKRILRFRQPGLTIVLEEVHDIHNISAMLRTSDAVGVMQVHGIFEKMQTGKKSRMGKRSSAGTRKWVKVEKYSSPAECFDVLRQQNFKIFTTKITADSKPLYALDLTQPVALVFGNEHDGVSEEAAALADGNFMIPQIGMAESLNVSVACAVSLYEAFRQRQLKGMYNSPQLPDAQLAELFEEWRKK